MFKFLKDKLKNWTQKIAGAEESEEPVEEIKETKKESKKSKPKKDKQTKKESKEEVEEVKGSEEKTESKEELSIELPEDVKEEIKKIEENKKVEDKIIDEEIKEIKEIIQEDVKEAKEKIEETKKSFFTKLKEKITKKEVQEKVEEIKPEDIKEEKGIVSRLKDKVTKTRISEENLNAHTEELEFLLLENNVAYEVVQKIIKEIKYELLGKDFNKKELEQEIRKNLKIIISNILIEPYDIEEEIKDRKDKNSPYVILFCGINGTGKTTTIAKIAHSLKKKGISCVMAAGDTFRAASIEQINKHGEALDIKVVSHAYGSDPASVGFDAISYAKKHAIDCVLIDTAGRMHTEKNLLKEIEKIVRVTKPHIKLFVGESITGNDMIEQAKAFDNSIHLDGIILTKADIDEKGGAALSVGYITKKPIIYLGIGQTYEDIEKFSKEKFLESLGL